MDTGYRITAKRLYKNGLEEIVTEPPTPPGTAVKAETRAEAQLLNLLSRGIRRGHDINRLEYKIAVACLHKNLYKKRNYCKNCFYKPHCALWKNPKWFKTKPNLSKQAEEIYTHNNDINRHKPTLTLNKPPKPHQNQHKPPQHT